MKETHIDLMEHALGLTPENPKSYRNYFAAAPNGRDIEEWQCLTDNGYAECHGSRTVSGDLIYFSVSGNGQQIVYERCRIKDARKPKLTRSQKRYKAYLELDCGETFFEFLKDTYYNDYRKSQGC